MRTLFVIPILLLIPFLSPQPPAAFQVEETTIAQIQNALRDGSLTCRSLVEQYVPFVEVYVATPLEECARRDPKGLYAAAFAGEIEEFTGVSAPYEEPLEPELRLETMGRTPGESAATVIDRLEELNLLPERVESEL